MKISESWLREWVNPELNTQLLVEQLTMAGLEVDSVEPAGIDLPGVVVAEVIHCEQHPNADKLNLCQVMDGSGDPVQVICGASNVRQGIRVAFARVGAVLPGIKIKKAKLRGVESHGMICSEQELQLAETSDGIMILPNDAPLGTPVTEYLQLDDTLIEVDLTPNRGDCLSVQGVAREVAANNGLPINSAYQGPVTAEIEDTFPVELVYPEACPVYCGRVIRGIDPNAETPLWMKEKLRRSGLRPISPVVDVTNFILMELGQPMHGFDLDKLSGGIVVRRAEENESCELLDGSSIECRSDTLVIADQQQAVAVAGIMGGMATSVTETTSNVFLEAAFFTPHLIAGKARSYGLHTDSSHRFERGVDPQLASIAIERATQLLIDIVGGQAGPVTRVEHQPSLPENPVIPLRLPRITRLLGIEIEMAQVTAILEHLDMKLTAVEADSWQVEAPSWRFDIKIEADLIEEVGRIYGYNNIPGKTEAARVAMESFSESLNELDLLKEQLISRGYYEAITYSFVSPELQQLFDPDQVSLSLQNPISSDMSEMRTGLIPGLVQAVQHNLNRQQNRVRLFETGLCFIPEVDSLRQTPRIAAIATGSLYPEHWDGESRSVDFFDIKGDLQSIIGIAMPEQFSFVKSDSKTLHPGQSADILYQGQKVGEIGVIHPQVLQQLGIQNRLIAFELDTDCLLQSRLPEFAELSRFPSIRRDLAVLVDRDLPVQSLLDEIASLNSEIIQHVFVFDVYTGDELTNNRKSVALGLILQGFSRTLTDEDVDTTVTDVLESLGKKYNAVLR